MLEMHFFSALCVRVIQECDTVLDFLNIDVYSGKNQEPNQDVDTHKYNPDIEIGNTEGLLKIFLFFVSKLYIVTLLKF